MVRGLVALTGMKMPEMPGVDFDVAPEAALLDSDAGDAAVAAQVGPLPKNHGIDKTVAMRELDRCRNQLAIARPQAAAFHCASLLDSAERRVARRVAGLAAATAQQAAEWGFAAGRQSEVLFQAVSGLSRASEKLRGPKGEDVALGSLPAAVAEPLRAIANAYARAAGSAELLQIARGHLAEAKKLEIHGTADALDSMLSDDLAGHEALRGQPEYRRGASRQGQKSAAQLNTDRRDARLDVATMRAGMLAGDTGAAAAAPDIATRARRIQVESQLKLLIARLGQVWDLLHSMNANWKTHATLSAGDIGSAKSRAGTLQTALSTLYRKWGAALNDIESGSESVDAQAAEAALLAAEKEFVGYLEEHDINGFLKSAYDEIDDAQTRAMILDIVLIIGVTVASMGVGAMAGGAAAAYRVSAMTEFIVSTAAESLTYSVLDAAAFGNDVSAQQLASDFAFNFAQFGMLRMWKGKVDASRFNRAVAGGMTPEVAIQTLPASLADKAVNVSVQGLIGGATAYAQMQYDALRTQGKFVGLTELRAAGMQGLGMIVANAIVGRRVERLKGFSHATTEKAKVAMQLRRAARRRASVFSKRKPTSPAAVHELVHADRKAIEAEAAYYRTLASEPEALAHSGMNEAQVGQLADSLDDSVADLKKYEISTALEPIADNEYFVPASKLGETRKKYSDLGAVVSPMVVNPAKKGHWIFAVKMPDGTSLRMHAKLEPPIFDAASISSLKNRIVGGTLPSEAAGHDMLRRLNDGELDALRELGAEPPKRLEEGLEWGLGMLPDGSHVVIRGEHGAVDWSAMPGVTPIAHTHARTTENRLPSGADGRRRVRFSDLVQPRSESLIAQALSFPSPQDVMFCAEHGWSKHVVHTPFEYADGWVTRSPGAKANRQNMSFIIEDASRWGADSLGRSMYVARLTASIDSGTIWSSEVVVVLSGRGDGRILFDTDPRSLKQGSRVRGANISSGLTSSTSSRGHAEAGGVPRHTRMGVDKSARLGELSKDPQTGGTNRKSIEEAGAILVAEAQGLVENPRRPDLHLGEPNLDFKVDGPNPYKWADVKTPVDLGDLTKQAVRIGRKSWLQKAGAADVLHVIDLKNISAAERETFAKNVVLGAREADGIVFINR